MQPIRSRFNTPTSKSEWSSKVRSLRTDWGSQRLAVVRGLLLRPRGVRAGAPLPRPVRGQVDPPPGARRLTRPQGPLRRPPDRRLVVTDVKAAGPLTTPVSKGHLPRGPVSRRLPWGQGRPRQRW